MLSICTHAVSLTFVSFISREFGPSLSGFFAMLVCIQVSQLEEEASEVFERCSGLEDELGAVQAQAHSHAQALAAAQAELEVYTAA